MRQLRPNCECCNRDLPSEALDARISSFECTFCTDCSDCSDCSDCTDTRLQGHCPKCGGERVRRPVRLTVKLLNKPASTERVF